MKKFIKTIAVVLAFSITLTACSGSSGTDSSSEGVKFDRKSLKQYINASVTQVEDQVFAMDGSEGLYTGGWKGNRPEGKGELIIGEYDYYSGEWSNGMLTGQCEMQTTYDGGIWKYYEGECSYNVPSGEGYMCIGCDNDPYIIDIYGDFSDESTLMYFKRDEKDKLVDIGYVIEDQLVSVVGCLDIDGIELPDYNETRYVGEVDKNNVPNGYGYSVWSRDGSDYFEWTLGSWKDGKIEGYYTFMSGRYSQGDGNDYEIISIDETIGYAENGKNVGEVVAYEYRNPDYSFYVTTNPFFWGGDWFLVIHKYNQDTNLKFELYDDGIYRAGKEMVEVHYNDGTCLYQEYFRWCYDEYDEIYRDGIYVKTDADGNVLDTGRINPKYCDGDDRDPKIWISDKDFTENDLKNLPKKNSSFFSETVMPIVIVGLAVTMVGAGVKAALTWGNDFEGSAADRYVNREKEYYQESARRRDLYHEYMKQAKKEMDIGNVYEAEKLYNEAQKYYNDAHFF